MKKSTLIPILATVGAATIALAGCAGGCGSCSSCSSCGGNTTSTTATLNSNWYATPGYDGIQPKFIGSVKGDVFSGSYEYAKYDVTYSKSGAGNSSYSVNYDKGVYETYFTAVYMPLTLIAEDFREDYEGDVATDPVSGAEGIIVYYYKTVFSIDVQFKVGQQTSETFSDSVVTETYFRPTEQNLRAVYSKQTARSHSPKVQQAGSLADAYEEIDRETVTSYNYKHTRAIVDEKVNGETKKKSYDTSSGAYDSNILYLAARAMGLSGGSQTVNVFYPMTGNGNSYTISGGSSGLTNDDTAKLLAISAIDNAIPTPAAEEGKDPPAKKIEYTSSTISLSSGGLSGTEQKVWFAKVPAGSENKLHGVMLKISTTLPYNLGSLTYLLNEIKFAEC